MNRNKNMFLRPRGKKAIRKRNGRSTSVTRLQHQENTLRRGVSRSRFFSFIFYEFPFTIEYIGWKEHQVGCRTLFKGL